jgi:RNA polymerase sigma factor (sigma-70 family)
MTEDQVLAERFEQSRGRLRGVAYRMLGSLSEADDAVQEAWLRLSRSGAEGVDNLDGWLTTVVARVCLNMLRSRRTRREVPIDSYVPDPLVSEVTAEGSDPEHEALLGDSVGLALLVVLETLSPAERLAFVLHDMFGVPFEDIAPIVERSPTAARQLASRARRRIRGTAPEPGTDPARQRKVIEAFMAASRAGDFEALVTLLHPDVVLRSDMGDKPLSGVLRGARTVAGQATTFRRIARLARPAWVNGTLGMVTTFGGETLSVMDVTIHDGLITEINILADRERLRRLGAREPAATSAAGPCGGARADPRWPT